MELVKGRHLLTSMHLQLTRTMGLGAALLILASASAAVADEPAELAPAANPIAQPAARSTIGKGRDVTANQKQLEEAMSLAHQGQHAQAESLLRDLLRTDRHEERAYAALMHLAGARELPALSRALDIAKRRLSIGFNLIQTDRFVLLSDVPPDQSSQNAQWAERTYEEFQRFATQCGLRPLPLEHKLVGVLFDRHSDYQSFAQAHDGMTNVAFTGYYSPRYDRVVFSLESDRPRRGAQRAAQTSHDIADAARAPAAAPPAPATTPLPKPVLGFDPRGAAEQVDHVHLADPDALPCGGAAKCVHETIHQLMFHTRVMAPEIQYPLWICEGLSTAFETSSPAEPFGPDCDFAPRRQAFENLLLRDDLIPLLELVTLTHLNGASPRITRAVYQQSYALVTWLYRERKEQLRDYLDMMRQEPAGRLAAQRHLQLFEHAFGNVDEIEHAWLAFERSGQRTTSSHQVRSN